MRAVKDILELGQRFPVFEQVGHICIMIHDHDHQMIGLGNVAYLIELLVGDNALASVTSLVGLHPVTLSCRGIPKWNDTGF